MLTDDQADERVKEGVAVLDRHGPPEWVRSIEWPRLAMGDCTRCVLGQVYGGDMFEAQRNERDEPSGWGIGIGLLGAFEIGEGRMTAEAVQRFAELNGFDRETGDGDGYQDYQVLRGAWIRWAAFNGHAPLSVLASVARADA